MRVLGVLTLLLFFVPCFSVVLAETTTISFEEDPTGDAYFSAEVNETKEIPIYIENAVNISYLSVNIKFDGEIIELKEISEGDFDIKYNYNEKPKITFSPDKPYTGDFLLARLLFQARDPKGQSTRISLEITEASDSAYNEVSYQTFDGVFDVRVPEETEDSDDSGGGSGSKLDSDLEGLMYADDKEQYAEENNLNLTDGKVKVEITTDEGKEQKDVDIDGLKNLTEDQSITKIEPYREFNWQDYLVPIILFIIIIGLALVYQGLR